MFYILAFSLLISSQTGHHTMTSIECIPGTDSVKVVVRFEYNLFLQDYQQTIFDDISIEKYSTYRPFPADLANNYINSKISLLTDKTLLYGKLVNLEETADGDIIMKILYRAGKKMKSFTIRNTLLTGLYTDIENLTIVKINDIEKGIKLTHEHNTETFYIK